MNFNSLINAFLEIVVTFLQDALVDTLTQFGNIISILIPF